MSVTVLVVLVCLWAWFLLPEAVRGRRALRLSRFQSVDDFEYSMSLLATTRGEPGRNVLVLHHPAAVTVEADRTSRADRPRPQTGSRHPRASAGGAGESPHVRRRRELLARLGGIAVVSLVLAVAFGGLLWPLAGLTTAAFAGYVALLAALASRTRATRRTVRALPAARPQEPSHIRVMGG